MMREVANDLNPGYIPIGHAHERTTACTACGASVLPEMFQTHDDWHARVNSH